MNRMALGVAAAAVMAGIGCAAAREGPPNGPWHGGGPRLFVLIDGRWEISGGEAASAASGIAAPSAPAAPPAPAPPPLPAVPAPNATGAEHMRFGLELYYRVPLRLGPAPAALWLPLSFGDGFSLDAREYWLMLPPGAW
ncbi:MAG: hypothetical protein LPL00_01565 [Alphaproteobacteria bacterium]|nr:hypothetical protein [Alphaproteobacteria bacterium]MDX5368084.1 hypothetical protein [Alphaproteobacteria bacterium]MDX5462923.1 hypothetical protein [Alphaproteobacteria bacterium]